LVGLDGDKFVFVERPVDKTIFNQAALESIDQIAANLQLGYVIAIDYGFLDEKFESTVQVRARHRNLDSPFQQIGDADITMSVHWRSIVERAQANGLRVAGFNDQHHFLTGIISRSECGDRGQSLLADSRKAKRELQTLLHPEMLGRAFQVLVLAKNVGPDTNPLAGFKFAPQLGQSG
jgi:SAM-dependent MidA family methyltransferase